MNRPKDENSDKAEKDTSTELATVAGTEAVITNSRLEGLANVIANLKGGGASGGGSFSMTDLLGMDSESKGVYDAMVIPIGGQEHDAYRILERCRLTKYEEGLYTDAMYVAEHGLGIPGFNGQLDFPMPNFAFWIVSKLRATVSNDGQSLAVFERVAAAWIQRLYQTQADLEKKAKAGIQQ